MAQRAWGVEAGVLAGGKVNADLHPGSYPNLIRVVGRGSGFPPPVTRRRLSVALIYSIPCAALLSPKGFGSEEGACRFVIAHVFSSPHPSSSLISSLALLPSPQKTPSVGSPWRAPPAARVVCPPSWRPSKTQNSFFWWTFPNGNFRENEKFFDFSSF